MKYNIVGISDIKRGGNSMKNRHLLRRYPVPTLNRPCLNKKNGLIPTKEDLKTLPLPYK